MLKMEVPLFEHFRVISMFTRNSSGANRIELCSSLCLGGLTPTAGLLSLVKKHVKIPVFCMLRPRHDHFVYTEDEMKIMAEDLCTLKSLGSDGFVFGALTKSGDVDEEKCKIIIGKAEALPVTFHRAFDCSPMDKWQENLRKIIRLGFSRVLTSGLAGTAQDGIEVIRSVIEETRGHMPIMIGSGIDERNLLDLMKSIGPVTRAHVEYHGSASSWVNKEVQSHVVFETAYPLKITRMEKVKKMRRILDEHENMI